MEIVVDIGPPQIRGLGFWPAGSTCPGRPVPGGEPKNAVRSLLPGCLERMCGPYEWGDVRDCRRLGIAERRRPRKPDGTTSRGAVDVGFTGGSPTASAAFPLSVRRSRNVGLSVAIHSRSATCP